MRRHAPVRRVHNLADLQVGGEVAQDVCIFTCYVEPSLAGAPAGSRYQFERTGYFCVDPDSAPARLVFNRTVSLRDTWAKIEKAEQS